jgi:hypothetical protein
MISSFALDPTVKVAHIFRSGTSYPGDFNSSQDILASLLKNVLAQGIKPGIVNEINPITNTGALVLSVEDTTTFKLTSGSAVYKDGTVLTLPYDITFDLDIPDDTTLSYLVAIEKFQGSSASRYNTTSEGSEPIETSNYFRVVLLFQSEYLYSDTPENYMLLGQVVIKPEPYVGFAVTPSADSRFQRAWFSCLDFEHRGSLGTGLVSSNNPHGLSMADLDSLPGMSYWEQQGLSGVISNVSANSRNRGDLVEQSISTFELTNNVLGGPTTFVLKKGAAYVLAIQTTQGDLVDFTYDRATRTVTCYPTVQISENLTVYAIVIHAGTVTHTAGSVVSVEAPLDSEYLVSRSKVISSFSTQDLDFQALAGAIADYLISVDTQGILSINPVPILQTNLLKLQNNRSMSEVFLPANTILNIALTNFMVPATFTLKLRITGKYNGALQTEDLVIVGPESVPGANERQFTVPSGLKLFSSELDINELPSGTQWVNTLLPYSSITDLQILAMDNLPTSLSLIFTQSIDVQENVGLARVFISRAGNITKIVDLREQKLFCEKKYSNFFYEDFHNPVNFNPLVSTLTLAGLANSLWQSTPMRLMKGLYRVCLGFDAYVQEVPIRLLGPSTTMATQVALATQDGRKHYELIVPSDGFYRLEVDTVNTGGTKVRELWLDRSIAQNGGLQALVNYPMRVYGSDFTLDDSAAISLIQPQGLELNVHLPSASFYPNSIFNLKNIGDKNVVIVPALGETIEGTSSWILQPLNHVRLTCVGNSWYVL